MTGIAVKGTFAAAVENAATPGRYPILPQSLVVASVSATQQPIGTTGMRLYALIQGVTNGTVGSVTITGLAPDGVTAVSETTTNISLTTINGAGFFDYTTKAGLWLDQREWNHRNWHGHYHIRLDHGVGHQRGQNPLPLQFHGG